MATLEAKLPQPEETRPPITQVGALGWVLENLLTPWYNALLTLISAAIVAAILIPGLRWVFAAVDAGGPRWGVLVTNLQLFGIGQYPLEQAWRVWVSIYLLAFLVGAGAGVWGRTLRVISFVGIGFSAFLTILPLLITEIYTLTTSLFVAGVAVATGLGWFIFQGRGQWGRWVVLGFVLSFPITFILLRGVSGVALVEPVGTGPWGGLLLTMILSVVGIIAAFPLGLALALGRRSELPIIRWFSIVYIEFIRGVPLISVLFFAQIMLPLFLPSNITIDRVARATVGIILFAAAYLAENVRGGLQAIPRGQFEAADALGLSNFQSMRLIVLPQALRAVIPALVGQFIGLFKDTSLVAIIGLFDLFSIGRTVLSQPDWLGTQREVFLFVAAVYWVFSYIMAYTSRQIEKELGVGER